MVYSNRCPSLYLNGVLVRSGLTSVNPSCPSTWLGERGVASANQGYYAGLLDEVSIYSRSLSGAEIQAIYAAGSAGKCTTPAPPYFVSLPANQTVTVGDNASFNVTAGGSSPLSYQWRFNSTNIDGATNSLLVLTNVQLTQAGGYSVQVANAYGTTNSPDASLTVNSAAPCASPSADLVSWWRGEGDGTDAVGGNDGVLQGGLSFGPGKVGQALLFNGTDASVGVGNKPSLNVGAGVGLTIEAWIRPASITEMMPVVEWNSGSEGNPYGVHLWTAVAGAGSLLANLVDTAGNYHGVQTAPGLLTPGVSQHVALSYDKATGQGKLYLNGQVVALENLGTFTPQTSYPCYLGFRPAGGVVRYAGAMDEVSLYARALSGAEIQAIYTAGAVGKCANSFAPNILSEPASQTVAVGADATFSVTAGGTAPLSYQWQFNGTNLAGATASSFTRTNVQLGDAGDYAVMVSNSVGTITSSNAVLTVNPPPPCLPHGGGLGQLVARRKQRRWIGPGATLALLQERPRVWPVAKSGRRSAWTG
ncbi:MAG: LamG-like jellyroll fold domain-containing protein [Verrucomicrobiota bacterium]